MPTMLTKAETKALRELIDSAKETFDTLPTAETLGSEGGVDDARERTDAKSEKWGEDEDNQNKVDGLEQIEAEIENYMTAYENMQSALDTLQELLA